jgi:hypothetical protein
VIRRVPLVCMHHLVGLCAVGCGLWAVGRRTPLTVVVIITASSEVELGELLVSTHLKAGRSVQHRGGAYAFAPAKSHSPSCPVLPSPIRSCIAARSAHRDSTMYRHLRH